MGTLKQYAGRRLLVTGSNGTVGRELVTLAEDAGAEIMRISRSEGSDLRDHARIADSLLRFRPEFVFHLAAAGVSGPADDEELRAVNVDALGALLGACARLERPPKCVRRRRACDSHWAMSLSLPEATQLRKLG